MKTNPFQAIREAIERGDCPEEIPEVEQGTANVEARNRHARPHPGPLPRGEGSGTGAGEKIKWPVEVARRVGETLVRAIMGGAQCGFCEVAGSVRRGKSEVGDVEILYVPLTVMRRKKGEMFESEEDGVNVILEGLLQGGTLAKRRNVNGSEVWGAQIKLARHVATGLPVDFFSTTTGSWWNYLVCRTGPAESNTMIAKAARARGWKWEPYSSGFGALDSEERFECRSEREVFEFVGLQYQEPRNR